MPEPAAVPESTTGFVLNIEEFDNGFVAHGLMGLVATDKTRDGAIEKLRKLTIRQIWPNLELKPEPAASPVAGVSADKAALKGIMALFSEPSPFYIKKLGSPITNADQAKIDAAFIAIEEALSKPDGLETATDEELDAALRANGLDPDEVLSTGFNKVCAKLKEVATERDLLKAELLKLAQPSAEGDGRMSKRYRAMVYFAVATLHLYRDELFPVTPDENLGTFAELNKHVITQVIAEAREYFAYELSHEQIGQAIAAYLTPSVSLPTPPVLPAPVAKEGRES